MKRDRPPSASKAVFLCPEEVSHERFAHGDYWLAECCGKGGAMRVGIYGAAQVSGRLRTFSIKYPRHQAA